MSRPRYEIHITDNNDGTKNATVRDNERFIRYIINRDIDYEWTIKNMDERSYKLLIEKYNNDNCKIYA